MLSFENGLSRYIRSLFVRMRCGVSSRFVLTDALMMCVVTHNPCCPDPLPLAYEQGAWLAAKATGNTAQFHPFAGVCVCLSVCVTRCIVRASGDNVHVVLIDKMKALLRYWDKQRLDPSTGLYTWYDQLESGV